MNPLTFDPAPGEKAEPIFVRIRLAALALILLGCMMAGGAFQWAHEVGRFGAHPSMWRILLFAGTPLIPLLWGTLWFGADAEKARRAWEAKE
jgi:hypothetical protein